MGSADSNYWCCWGSVAPPADCCSLYALLHWHGSVVTLGGWILELLWFLIWKHCSISIASRDRMTPQLNINLTKNNSGREDSM